MIRLIGLWLVGSALCVTPVAADEDVYDGPTAIKPLTVTPQAAAVRPAQHCLRFRTSMLSREGRTRGPGSRGSSGRGHQARRSPAPVPDDPLVAAWRDCIGQALQNYEQSHDIHALQVATGSCQVRLEEQGDENFAGVEPPMPLTAPAQQGGRRNIGCGWWPIGSDADRDCATGGRRF